MQDYALTIDKLLDHAAKWSGEREVVSACPGQPDARVGYAALRARSNRLSGALFALGLARGDRLGTLAWNTQHHLELYYAAMAAGLVCHTLNPRFTVAQLAAIINEAGDRVLAVAVDLLPLLHEVAPLCPGLEHVIVIDVPPGRTEDPTNPNVTIWLHEELLSDKGASIPWGGFDERAPAGLCYTSGTTGNPKGVMYTHRSNYLHTLRSLQADAMAIVPGDVVLVAVPMFHANGWGLPFVGPAVGCKLVLPGRNTGGENLTRLMREEKVTFAAGVQTVWLSVIDHLDATGGELPDLKRVLIGGSKCPGRLIRYMEERLGVRVQTSWGMTELSPLGTIASPDASAEAALTDGRPPLGLDLKLTDADGVALENQRGAVGHLKVRGHSVIQRYFNAAANACDDDGFFDTGDLATIDDAGNLTICGRTKDLIKSGGEWINPLEIENLVSQHPTVALAAVIGRADEKWGERPLLIVEARAGAILDAGVLLDSLRGRVASWWIPDDVVEVATMPLAGTGKVDKQRLRAEFAGFTVATEPAGG